MTRRQGPLRRFLGPPGSPLRRWLRALPVIGGFLRRLVRCYRTIRDAWRRSKLRLERARTDFKNRRAETASNITRRNTRRAYERVYRDDRLLGEYLDPVRLSFYEEVAELVAPLCRQGAVVDVGCGAGTLLREIVVRAAPTRVVGADYAAPGIQRAQQAVPIGEFHVQSLYELRLRETFEVVLCTEVLEHLSKPTRAMEVLVGLCAPSGTIVITVPDGAEDTWPGHRNFWTESGLESFLEPYGEVEVSRLRSAPLSLLARVRPGGMGSDGRG